MKSILHCVVLCTKLENLMEYRGTTHRLNTGVSGLEILKRNGIVSISYNGAHDGGPSNILYTLPIDYRPYTMHRVSIFPTSGYNTNIIVYNNGNIVVDCGHNGPTSVSAGLSFLISE